MMLPECPRRHLAGLSPDPLSSSKTGRPSGKRAKKWYALGEFTQFSIFRSKCRKSIIFASKNAHHGTKSHAFSFEKNGEKMGQIRLLWGKNGEVF
jgi:hypothetical protein